MADHSNHPTTVRGIDYKATFPFVHLFKGFRLAIDPSKILLALALLLLVYGGGRLLDAVWPTRHKAIHNEIGLYTVDPVDFDAARDRRIRDRDDTVRHELAALGHRDFPPDLAHHEQALREQRDLHIKSINDRYNGLKPATPADADRQKRERDEAERAEHNRYANEVIEAKALQPEGLFIHFLKYEVDTLNEVAGSATGFQIPAVVNGLSRFFFTAPAWAFREHGVFFSIFFAWLLLLWSIFGGALARIAAVQVARDEKISVRQSLRFSTGKVLSFVFAPLIPLIIIAVLGLLLAIVSILISVPGVSGVWSIVVGAGFFLALLAGLVMMLTAVGLIGGGHLMYPTIAAEGSDSFDAVSRSFSYLYARPWQLGFYALVSLIYGAVTYLVVRLALFILLLLVHGSVSLFQWDHAADGTPIIDAMWPRPGNFMDLEFETKYAALGPVQSIGAALMACWVYFAISILGAYVISLYSCSSTLIYFLLRRDVDATDLDEVYLEPNDEELTEAAVTTEATLSPDSPPAAEPSGQPIDIPAPPQNG